MTRIIENQLTIEKITEESRRKPEGTYEEMVTFQLGAIASMLADISRSLAILADMTESEE